MGGSIFPPFSPRDYEQGPRRNDVVVAAPLASLLLREGCVYASPAERNSKHKSCYRLVGSNKHTQRRAQLRAGEQRSAARKVTYWRP